ncbi:hypothetical protein GCM10023317_72770 [Actinopolymorpha pittospori]
MEAGPTVSAAHGTLPVPPPAVVELLAAANAPFYAGDDGRSLVGELCTPTGAALLATHVIGWTSQPPMRVLRQGFGAGTREIAGRANVLRLLVGEIVPAAGLAPQLA